jgi:predicted  nucleic acid-binding Zn-ribbon protein
MAKLEPLEASGDALRFKLELTHEGETARLMVFVGTRLRFGRSPQQGDAPRQNDLILRAFKWGMEGKRQRHLRSQRVSSHHGTFVVTKTGVAIMDEKSTGGTKLDGRSLRPDELYGLPHRFVVFVGDAVMMRGRVLPSADNPNRLGGLILERNRDGGHHAYLLLVDAVTIGGGADDGVCLPLAEIKERHVKLSVKDGVLQTTALRDDVLVKVGGQELARDETAPFKPGATLALGTEGITCYEAEDEDMLPPAPAGSTSPTPPEPMAVPPAPPATASTSAPPRHGGRLPARAESRAGRPPLANQRAAVSTPTGPAPSATLSWQARLRWPLVAVACLALAVLLGLGWNRSYRSWRGELDRLETQRSDRQAALQALSQETRQRLSALEGVEQRVGDLELHLDRALDEVEALRVEKDRILEQRAETAHLLAEAQDALESIDGQCVALEADLARLQEDHTVLRAERARLTNDLSAAREAAGVAESRLTDAAGDVEALEGRVSGLEQASRRLQESLDGARGERAAAVAETAEARGRLDGLTEQLTSTRAELGQARTELGASQVELTAAREGLAAATTRLSQMEQDLRRLEPTTLQLELRSLSSEDDQPLDWVDLSPGDEVALAHEQLRGLLTGPCAIRVELSLADEVEDVELILQLTGSGDVRATGEPAGPSRRIAWLVQRGSSTEGLRLRTSEGSAACRITSASLTVTPLTPELALRLEQLTREE